MLDNKNNKYYGVDSGCGSPQNWGNLQSAYSLRSHQSWWTSKGVKGAVLGLGLATLLPLTNAFADPASVTIKGWNPGNEIHIPYGTDLTDRNVALRDHDGAYAVKVTTMKDGKEVELTLGTESNPKDGYVKFYTEQLGAHYDAGTTAVDQVWLEFIPNNSAQYRTATTGKVNLFIDPISVTYAGRDWPDYSRATVAHPSAGNYVGKSLMWKGVTDATTIAKTSIPWGDSLNSLFAKNLLQEPIDVWSSNRKLDGTLTFTVINKDTGATVVDNKSKADASAVVLAEGTYKVIAKFIPEDKDNRHDGSNYLPNKSYQTDFSGDYKWDEWDDPDETPLDYEATHPYATALELTVSPSGDLSKIFKLTANDLETIEYGVWLKDLIIEKAKANGTSDDVLFGNADKGINPATYDVWTLTWNGNANRWDRVAHWEGVDKVDPDQPKKFALAGVAIKGKMTGEIENPKSTDIYPDPDDSSVNIDYYTARTTAGLPSFQVGNTYNLDIIVHFDNYSDYTIRLEARQGKGITVVKALPKLYWIDRDPDKDGGDLTAVEAGAPLNDNKVERLSLKVEHDPVNGRPLDPRVYETDETEDSENYTLPVVKYTRDGSDEPLHGDSTIDNPGVYTIEAEYYIGKRNQERDYYFGTETEDTIITTATLEVFQKTVPTVDWPYYTASQKTFDYGTALTTDNVLNATCTGGVVTYTLEGRTPGRIVPAREVVLNMVPDVGSHIVTMTFTPYDTVRYSKVIQTAALTINPVLPHLDWFADEAHNNYFPNFVYGQDSINKMNDLSGAQDPQHYQVFRNNVETKTGDMADNGRTTFNIPYGKDKTYKYIEEIGDMGPCLFYAIDELNLNKEQSLSQAIQDLVNDIKRDGLDQKNTVFVVGYDFSKQELVEDGQYPHRWDNLEQYIGANKTPNASKEPLQYGVPVHFVAIGVKAYRFLSTLSPVENPIQGTLVVQKFNLEEDGLGIGYAVEAGYENHSSTHREPNKKWKDQGDITIKYGEILGKSTVTNAFYGQDAFYNDHYLAQWKETVDGKEVRKTDPNRPGTISYQIKRNDGKKDYTVDETWDILNGKSPLPVHKVYDNNGNYVKNKSGYTLVAIFTPTAANADNYAVVTETRRVDVEKQTITPAWQPKEYIFYGEYLSVDQLNATFSAPYLGRTIDMAQAGAIKYYYGKISRFDGDTPVVKNEDWKEVSLSTVTKPENWLNVVWENNYDYVLKVKYSPQGSGYDSDANNYNATSDVLRNFTVYPVVLTIQPRDVSINAGERRPVPLPHDVFGLQFNDDQVCPKAWITMTPWAEYIPDPGVYESWVQNEAEFRTATETWNPLNYTYVFNRGHLYVGKNPIIVWGPLDPVVIDGYYGDCVDPTTAQGPKAYDPVTYVDREHPGTQLAGKWEFTYAGVTITPSGEKGLVRMYQGKEVKNNIGSRTLYATFTPDDETYLPSTSQIELWVQDRPEIRWNEDNKGNLQVEYGKGLTEAQILNYARVVSYATGADIKSKGEVSREWVSDPNPENNRKEAKRSTPGPLYSLKLDFKPTGAKNQKTYANAKTRTADVEVIKANPQWAAWNPTPTEMWYGSRFSDETHLNARVIGPDVLLDEQTGEALGKITYKVNNPPAVGVNKLYATFTPDDKENFNESANHEANNTVLVKKAELDLKWNKGDQKKITVTYGDKLEEYFVQKSPVYSKNPDDSAPVAGKLDPEKTTIDGTKVDPVKALPNASDTAHKMSITFAPTESDNYENATIERDLVVNKQTPSLATTQSWSSDIEYGTFFKPAEWFKVTGKELGENVTLTNITWSYKMYRWKYDNRNANRNGDYREFSINPETELLDFNADAADAADKGVKAYKVKVTATPAGDDAVNYKSKELELTFNIVPTTNPSPSYPVDETHPENIIKNMWIYALDENGEVIDGERAQNTPIERTWDPTGIDFTQVVTALSTVTGAKEEGKALQGEFTMTLTRQVEVEQAADAAAQYSTPSKYTIEWNTDSSAVKIYDSDDPDKKALKSADVTSGKYHISVTFTPWGYKYPHPQYQHTDPKENRYASRGYNRSDYQNSVTRKTATDTAGIATDVFLMYIDPMVYITTPWDSQGVAATDAEKATYPELAKARKYENSGTDEYPQLNTLMSPLLISYKYANTGSHTYKINDLFNKRKPVDAERYARNNNDQYVVEGAFADNGERTKLTWTVNGEEATVPAEIKNLEPGWYTLTIEFKADWDEYRHYFDGVWTKTIYFHVYRESAKPVWKPKDLVYREAEFIKEEFTDRGRTYPGADQRNGYASVPGAFYYPGADMSETDVPTNLWPSESWPTDVKVANNTIQPPLAHEVYATFVPEDRNTYDVERVKAYLTVVPDEVMTLWTPDPMKFGETPGPDQFNAYAIAVTPFDNGVVINDTYGKFDYPTNNWPKDAGQHTVVAIFKPNVPKNYVDYTGNPGHDSSAAGRYTIRATALLTIEKAVADFVWDHPVPLEMGYDDVFTSDMLKVTSKVPGHAIITCEGKPVVTGMAFSSLKLTGKTQYEMKARWIPADSKNYDEAPAQTALLTITNGGITLSWSPKSEIGYTTPLDKESYLNATATRNGVDVTEDGIWTYTPVEGTTAEEAQKQIGDEWELSATFTIDGETTDPITATVKVVAASMDIEFENESFGTYYGQLIDEEIAGVIVTDPATGEPFDKGTFTYTVAPIDEDGTVGETLTNEVTDEETGETEVVPVDPSVDALPVGKYALTATFTPYDTETYGPAVTTETPAILTVVESEPLVEMTDPISLPYGILFEDAMGTASEGGFWVYTAKNRYNDSEELNPVEAESLEFAFVDATGKTYTEKDEPLPVGTYKATMTFNPADSDNYTTTTATAIVTVGRATPILNWYPEPIVFAYGDELPASVLTAKAFSNADGKEVEGTFDYLLNGEPVQVGALFINMLGVQELTAVFNPANTNSYTSPRETVELHVYEGGLTPVTVRADDKIITYGQPAELTYTVDPEGAATAKLSTTYKGEFVGVYDITFDSVTPTADNTYAIDNPIPGRLTVNPATPTVEFYELLTKDGEESVSEEPLQTISLIYGDVMEFDTENAIITITNQNKDDDADDDDDDDSEVESASDTAADDDADDDDEPVVVRTIKVVAKDINGDAMDPATIAFTLDGVNVDDVEQPLEPQEEAYTLTVAFTFSNKNYVGVNANIPVTVAVDEDALDVEWPIPSHDFTWTEGNSWAEYGFEKNAEATVYGVKVAEKEDKGLSYWMAKLPADVEIPEDVDPEDLDLEDFGLTVGDLDLAEFDPEAIVAEAGVYYLVAIYADTLYGIDADEDIVLFVEPEPVYQDLTVTVDKQQLVYGTEINPTAYTVTPAEFQDIVEVTLVPEVAYVGNVGTYDLFAFVDETTIPEGYKLVTNPVIGKGMLEVTPLSVTVTALDQTIKAGTEPSEDVNVAYVVDPEDAPVSVALDFGGYAGVAGKYVITPAAATDNLNYTIAEPVKGTLTVTELVSVTIVPVVAPITYGDPAPAQTAYSYEPADVKIIGTPIYSTIYKAGLPASASGYDIFIDNPNELKAEGYDVVFAKHGKLIVEQAYVDVTVVIAKDGEITDSMITGDNIVDYLDYTTNPEGLTGAIVYGVYDENEELVAEVDPEEDKYQTLPVGTYTVEPLIFLADDSNYRFGTYEAATLTVEAPAPVYVVEWNVPETIVYGTTIALNATVTKDGEPVLDPVIEYYLDNEETPLLEGWILDVDSYSVIAVYAETGDKCVKPVTVTPKDLDVTMDGAEVVYGELLTKLPEVKIEGLLEGDTVEYDVTSIYHAGTTPAGTYKDGIIATLAVGSDNYTAREQVTSTLTVKKATQEVLLVVNPTVLNVDESATATVVTTSGLPATIAISDESILSPNLVALKVGTVTVIAKQAGDNNYEPAESDPVIVTVAPKADVQITWEPKSPIAYGTILSAEHLNATASLDGQTVEGHFYYNPTFGYVVTPESRFVVNGKLRLSATFVPTDRKRFKNAYIEVLVDIETEDDTTDDGDEEAPALTISKAGSAKGLVNAAADALVITFTGTLEESTDGVTWTPVVGAEDGTYVVDVKVANQKFYRSVK